MYWNEEKYKVKVCCIDDHVICLYATMKNFGLHDQTWEESLLQKIYKSSFFSINLRTKKKPYYRYL